MRATVLLGITFLGLLSVGCANVRPVAVGAGYFGMGAFVDRRQNEEGLPPHIDLEGFGALIMPGRFILGYCNLNAVYRNDIVRSGRIRLSKSEVAFGVDADLMAEEFAAETLESYLDNKQ